MRYLVCRSRLVLVTLLLMVLSGCTPASVGDAREVGSTETELTLTSTAIVCNCGESNEVIRQRVERAYTSTALIQWEFRGGIGVGVKINVAGAELDITPAIEGAYGRSWAASRTQTVGFDLPAQPNTQMEYTVQWSEVWQPGIISVGTVAGSEQVKYRYLREIQGNLVDQGGKNIGCSQGCMGALTKVEHQVVRVTGVPPAITVVPPAITVVNQLRLPVHIYIDDIYKTDINRDGTKTFLLDRYPIKVGFEVVKQTTSQGTQIGDDMGGHWSEVYPNRELVIRNLIGSQLYFYPVITNPTSTSCDFSVNDGYVSENRPGASVPASSEKVPLGYYRLYSNSNVTLYCDSSRPDAYYYWGLRPGATSTGTSFVDSVQSDSGYVSFALKP
jgi:hypothetical protein